MSSEVLRRSKVRFLSGGSECVAWFYPGSNGGCVVMAGGFAVTKEPATDRFARQFHEAGYAVLAFDYRHLGESSGRPRQIVGVDRQLADWDAAIAYAATLPGVDPARVAVWGFSLSGGHVLTVAARNRHVAAVIAQTPNLDGPALTRNAARHQSRGALLGLMARAVRDELGGLVGRVPLTVPLAGPPGSVAVLTTPDGRLTGEVLNPENRYPEWKQVVAARSVLRLGLYRPGRDAPDVRCPILFLVCDRDESALPGPGVRAAGQCDHGELVRLSGNHYAPFTTEHEHAVDAQLSFLRRHLP